MVSAIFHWFQLFYFLTRIIPEDHFPSLYSENMSRYKNYFCLLTSGKNNSKFVIYYFTLIEICLVPFQMVDAPSAHRGKLGESSKSRVTDDDIEKQLAALKDL